ncbi:MAG: ABC transporter substrate-binding protein [Gammaproteobacteria bacterium]|nr:ABC transporter substrate-binding protein [Gammaproteobacteria bacterium]
MFALTPPSKAVDITWAVNPAPPFHILQQPLQQQGICDVLIERVRHYLPELTHHIQLMPQKRVDVSFNAGTNLCFPCMIHKPDEPRSLYSLPTHIYRPHGIIASKRVAKAIVSRYQTPVSFAYLLQDNSLLFAYPNGRKMGILQSVIEAYMGEENGLVDPGVEGAVKLLHLIEAGRLDYSVDFDIVLRYYNLISGKELDFIPVKENQQQLVFGAVGCTNNAWGKTVIEEINRIMPQLLQDKVYIDNLLFWFDPDNKQDYRLLLQQMQQDLLADNQ